jgi:hypothetical protein
MHTRNQAFLLLRARRLALFAGAWFAGAAGCGRSETCSSALFDYAGTKSGPIWFTMVSDDEGRSLSSAEGRFIVPNPPWRNIPSAETCTGNSLGPDIPLTATAWLDTAGSAATNCVTLERPLCRPAPGDPQAQQKVVLRAGERVTLHFTLVDPP